jgi:hypothetical protein
MPQPEPALPADAAPSLTVWYGRIPVDGNRWIDHRWEIVGLELDAAAPQTSADGQRVPRASPPLQLHGDEAEGYLLNLTASEPSLFVLVRSAEDDGNPAEAGPPRIAAISASFHEAARWIDGGETVERLPLPATWAEAIEAYARSRLKPPEEKRPKRRYAEAGDKHERPGH